MRSGGDLEFHLETRATSLILQATYWGGERPRDFDILVDDMKVATQHLDNDRPGRFFDVDYPLPIGATAGKAAIRGKMAPHDRSTAGPVFGMRFYTARPGATA